MHLKSVITVLFFFGFTKGAILNGGIQCRDLSDRCFELVTNGICQTMSANLCAATCGQCYRFPNQQGPFSQNFQIGVEEVIPRRSTRGPFSMGVENEQKSRQKRQILPFPDNSNSMEIPFPIDAKNGKKIAFPYKPINRQESVNQNKGVWDPLPRVPDDSNHKKQD